MFAQCNPIPFTQTQRDMGLGIWFLGFVGVAIAIVLRILHVVTARGSLLIKANLIGFDRTEGTSSIC